MGDSVGALVGESVGDSVGVSVGVSVGDSVAAHRRRPAGRSKGHIVEPSLVLCLGPRLEFHLEPHLASTLRLLLRIEPRFCGALSRACMALRLKLRLVFLARDAGNRQTCGPAADRREMEHVCGQLGSG